MPIVTGRIVDSSGAPKPAAPLTVVLRSSYAGTNRAALGPLAATTAGDGTFSLDLQAGRYTLNFGQRDTLTFEVPLEPDTYNITDLIV